MNLLFPALAVALTGIQASVFALPEIKEYQLYAEPSNGTSSWKISNVVPVGTDLVATIIPSPLIAENSLTHPSIVIPTEAGEGKAPSSKTIPCQLFSKELLTGLVLLKLKEPLGAPPLKTIVSSDLKKGSGITYKESTGELINGIFVGTEHSSSGVNFPLPLLRVQFSPINPPFLGQACYTNNGELVGLVIATSSRGICHLLPSEAISHLTQEPTSKRVRLGCLLDINGSIPEIIGLVKNGPMQKSGVKTGDIITSINGIPVNSYKDFLNIAYYLPSEEQVDLKIIRDNHLLEIKGIVPEEGVR